MIEGRQGPRGRRHEKYVPVGAGRLLSIDLMRAIAAFGVFVFHASLSAGFDKFRLEISLPGLDQALALPNFLSLGAMGVSMFFIVSGYCLTQSRIQRGKGLFDLSSYYYSRFSRIYPVYFFSLLIALLVWWVFAGSEALFVEFDGGRPALLPDFIVHALFLQGFSNKSFLSFNGPLWSMATEVQFYIVFPLVYLILRRAGGFAVLAALAACLLIRYSAMANPELSTPVHQGVSTSVLVSYSLLGRAFEFMLGMWVAVLHRELRLPRIRFWHVAGFVLLAVFCTLKGGGWTVDPAWGLAFGALLIWALFEIDQRSGYLQAKSRVVRAIRALGIYSYSFFLIHWVILFISDKAGWLDQYDSWVRFFIEMPVCFIVSLFLARWMYHHVEVGGMDRMRKLFGILVSARAK